MKALRHLVLAASAAILAACASTTPYQPASAPGAFDGYSQTMLDNSTAKITFGGNSLTNRETVENYLLYRAAEMAVERGHDHFSLVNQDTEKNTRVNYQPTLGSSYGYGGRGYDPYFRYSFYQPRRGWTPFNRYSFWRRGIHRDRGFGFMGRSNDPFYRDDFRVRETTKYRASAQVAFGRTASPGSDHMFNAREILANLGPSIVFPEK